MMMATTTAASTGDSAGLPLPPAVPSGDALRDLTSLAPREVLRERIRRGDKAEEQLPVQRERERFLTEQKIRLQQSNTERLAKEAVGLEEQYGIGSKEARETRRAQTVAEPEFKPSKMELDDYRNLAGMLVGIGMLAGTSGKSGAMYALNSLNGMMKGFAEGRRDLFKNEQVKFEKQLKSIDATNRRVQRDFEDAMSLLQTDRQLGLAKMERLKAELGNSVAGIDLQLNNTAKVYADLKDQVRQSGEALKILSDLQDKEAAREARAAEVKARRIAQEAYQNEMLEVRRQGLALQREGLDLRKQQADAKVAAQPTLKPPPKEIVQQNALRNSLIPKLQEAIPILDRLHKENKWGTLTTLLAVPGYGTNVAERQFKDDPEALNLILTLAYFRSKEFETAGKALTRKEDQILAPIVRGDLRVYEGMRNAMSQGLKTLKQEQAGLEKTYPYLEAYNKAFRGDVAEPSGPSKQLSEQDQAALAWANANPSDSRSAAIKARLGVQ